MIMKRTLGKAVSTCLKFAKKHKLAITIGTTVLVGIIAFLSRIPGQAAEAEHSLAQSAQSLGSIYDSPINAPYKLLVLISTLISSSILAVRSISLVVFFGVIVAVFYTLQHWHSKNAAILATIAFGTNSVVLAVGRLGTPLVTVFGWFIFTAMLLWQVHGNSNKLVPSAVILGVATLLYVPGAPWFFLIFLFFYWDRFKKAFLHVKKTGVLFGALIGLLIITPLLLGFVRDPSTIRDWLMLSESIELSSVYRSILEVPSAFVYKLPRDALLNIGTLPVFDLASGFLFLIGLNAYRKKISLDRTRLMIVMALIAVLVGAFGQTITAIVLLLPFAFSMIAAGIEFLLDEWNSVFPKNPFAQSFGVVVIAVVVLFGAYYQLTRFLVVWPQAPETHEVYDRGRIIE